MLATMSQIICSLLEARTVAHKYHLNTMSYAQHVALGEFYEGIGDIADALAEESQGYLREFLHLELECGVVYTPGEPTEFLYDLVEELRGYREGIPEEATHILNTLDSAFSLISRTQYKLKFLS